MDVILDLVAQITANNAYTDVHLVFLYNEKKDAEGEWDFTKWLPHVWNETKTFRYVASNQEEASEVCYELLKIFRERLENREEKKEIYIIDYNHELDLLADRMKQARRNHPWDFYPQG